MPRWCAGAICLAILAGCSAGANTAKTTTSIAVPTTAPATAATPAPTTLPPTTLPPPTTAPPHVRCRAAYIGDSIGWGTLRNGLAAALAKVGCPLVWSSARPGMETAEGAAIIRKAGPAGSNVLIASLGYVRTKAHVQKGEFAKLIDLVMAAAGKRVVVWPLLGRTPECSAGYSQAIIVANRQLEAAKERYPNLVLADYKTFITSHPEYTQNRCPHLTNAGYQQRALWLAGEVRRLVDLHAAGLPTD